MTFVRAPDENVFIPPLNLIEIFCLAIPFEWWMSKKTYEHLNDIVMAALYSPLLLVSAYFEMRTAQEIRGNRARGEEDDDTIEEWEQMSDHFDFEGDGWSKTVASAKSNLEEDADVVEIKKLKQEVEELKKMIEGLTKFIAGEKGLGNGDTEELKGVDEEGESSGGA